MDSIAHKKGPSLWTCSHANTHLLKNRFVLATSMHAQVRIYMFGYTPVNVAWRVCGSMNDDVESSKHFPINQLSVQHRGSKGSGSSSNCINHNEIEPKVTAQLVSMW